ncbi:penicillin-binding protein 1A [Microvirga sp. W0021]|uniref:Penicillin-binding protein 1A n=1 Tax=Hohaiivirga grylli TaxID=3133970 RepID=A0ABV0BN55_9HYPH
MRFILRFFGIFFSIAAVLFVLGAAAAVFFYFKYSEGLPDHQQLADYEPPVMTRFHASDGSILAEYAKERRLYLPIQSMPKLLVHSFLSAEDKNFYKHMGVDPEGVIRALVKNASGSAREQGASTITQQVAKNFLLGNERSYERKIREALIALRIESTFNKDHILELYLNEIFLGNRSYGVAAAALNYFGKSVNELTVAQAAYLAALPKAPNNYHPVLHKKVAIERRNWVIERMLENGYIDQQTAATAKKEPLEIVARRVSPNSISAGYFAEEVRRDISERYGEDKLYEGGLSVRTTLDPKMQAMARKALVDGLVRFDEARGWRGTETKLDLSAGEWGAQLAELPALGDINPWRLAVVTEVSGNQAKIGLRPRKIAGNRVEAERITGVITAEGVKWTRKGVAAALKAGDVVYVEPLTGKAGQYRLRQVPAISGALVAMDPYTGRVLAMVGGFSYDQSEFNRATQALRQVGSSFKPIVYATALDNGYTPSTAILDGPITINMPGVGVWSPTNYGKRSGTGPKPLRYGIEYSKNQMTVRLASFLGMPLVVDYARRLGIYDDLLPVLSMSLGAGETTVLRMTTAYSILNNGGRRIKPTLIDRVQDRTGKTIYSHDERKCPECDVAKWDGQDEPTLIDNREQVLDPLSAYQITSILEGVVNRGTAQIVRSVGKPLAGKTGTTNDAKDVWFMGFSPDLTVGVFLGYDRPRSLGNSATAGQYAAPVFRDFMAMALKDKPATPFRVPAGIKLIRVVGATGLRAGQGESGRGIVTEAFKPGTTPPDYFPTMENDSDGGYYDDGGGAAEPPPQEAPRSRGLFGGW